MACFHFLLEIKAGSISGRLGPGWPALSNCRQGGATGTGLLGVFSLPFWAACSLLGSCAILRLDFPGEHWVAPGVPGTGMLCLLLPCSPSADHSLEHPQLQRLSLHGKAIGVADSVFPFAIISGLPWPEAPSSALGHPAHLSSGRGRGGNPWPARPLLQPCLCWLPLRGPFHGMGNS